MIPDLSLCNLVTKSARVVQRQYQEAVASCGITAPQAGLIYFLSIAGPCSQAELARLVKLDRATVNAMIRKLEKKGFVATGLDPEDRRLSLVRLEAAGNELVPKLFEVDRKMGERYLDLAGNPENARVIRRFLESIVCEEE